MADDPLTRLKERFPDEAAAAERLAVQQALEVAQLEPSRCTTFGSGATIEGPARAAVASEQSGSPGRGGDDPGVHYWPLDRINAAFADSTLGPLALLEALLARIDLLDPQLNCFVALDRVGATAAARASAERRASGRPIGPLDGIPVGIKDVIDVVGMPTRCHSRVTPAAPVSHDAAIVAQLREAGAVILGKLATHEFAIGGPAFDLPFPPARNPWNRDYHPGGSSSGAGAAVAAGLVPLAVGTDTAGSVRNPASACGVVGLKPGLGVLPLAGIVPLAPTLDHVGLLTRSVADMDLAAAALGVVTTRLPVGRVGYVRHFHTRDMTATPEVAAALDRAAAALGAVEIALPPLGAFALVNRVILQTEGYAQHGVHLRARPEALSHLTRAALAPGAFTSAETLALAMQARVALIAAVEAAFADIDILLAASSMEPPCRIDQPSEIARTYMLQARSPFNVTGHPALAMGAGQSADGLPLSVQFAARMGEEGRLLAAAEVWERAIGGRPPPIA